MRSWHLSSGDPLQLSLAADPRLGPVDYPNDVIWELSFGRGEPPALAVQTTFGLRARWMQFFPVFNRGGTTIVDPADFHRGPALEHFYPNYLDVSFAPFDGLEARAEYRVVSSQVLAGRLRLANPSVLPHKLRLDWAGLLNPLDHGEGMAVLPIGLGVALQGNTDGLSIVCFMTGGPQANRDVYPGLSLPVELYPGANAELFWAVAAEPNQEEAFAQAQAACERPWEAETARIELRNTADTLEIATGNPEWDAVLALTQKTALGLLMSNPEKLPAPSYVLNRHIDQGASPRGDGSDHPHLWAGQTALGSWYLTSLLPGMPGLAEDLLRNFLASAERDQPDFRPGLGGQRTHYLAQPLLAWLALASPSIDFQREAYPALLSFFRAWLGDDRDGDGLPEWEHPIQTGLENAPIYDRWSAGAEGVEITTLESPGLGALLFREAGSLIQLAERLGCTGDIPWLKEQAARIHQAVEETWDKHGHRYRYRDALTHTSRAGHTLLAFRGPGTHLVKRKMPAPSHLVIHLDLPNENTRAVFLTLSGLDEQGQPQEEELNARDFTWAGRSACATTRQVFSQALRLDASGLLPTDQARLAQPNFSLEDLSLYLPLWAGIPSETRAKALAEGHLLKRYLQPYGLPLNPGSPDPGQPFLSELTGVSMLWNALLGEGLLDAGYRAEAADLTGRLMEAVLLNLKQGQGFRQFYRASDGQGFGERNHLWGLPPLGLFLRCLGVDAITSREISIRGFNPFPWPITVKYQRITVTRDGDATSVTLPGRLPLTLTGPEPRHISLA